MKALIAAFESAVEKNPKMATSIIRMMCDLIDADPALMTEFVEFVKTKTA